VIGVSTLAQAPPNVLPALDPDQFADAEPRQPLADDEIHLWFFPGWERSGHAAAAPQVRRLLASYLDCAESELRLERTERGKPRLTGAELQFNLSHTGSALLIGISRNTPLGVDIETSGRRTRPVLELARRWFAPSEAAALAALPKGRRQAAFLRLWTCKEAVLKAAGIGIGHGLHRAEFALSAAGEVTGLRAHGLQPETWNVQPLAPDDAHVAALAWAGPPLALRRFVKQAIARAAQSG